MLPLRRSTVNSLRRVRNFETRARRIRPHVDAFDPDADQWLVEFENYSSRPVRVVPSAREPIGTGKPSKSPSTPLTARPSQRTAQNHPRADLRDMSGSHFYSNCPEYVSRFNNSSTKLMRKLVFTAREARP